MPDDSSQTPGTDPEPKPLDYYSAQISPYDRPVERYVRLADRINRIRRPRRLIYFAILLSAIATLLWYIHRMLKQYEQLIGP